MPDPATVLCKNFVVFVGLTTLKTIRSCVVAYQVRKSGDSVTGSTGSTGVG